jgi:hypothetical protein
MKRLAQIAALGLVLIASPMLAQDDGGSDGGMENIVVTGNRRSGSLNTVTAGGMAVIDRRPVIGLRRQADSALRRIEITSDSLDEDVRRKEVEAMLLSALDRAKGAGLSVVIGEFVVVEVTRENWKDLFPGLAGKSVALDDDNDNDDDDDNGRAKSRFEDDGRTATLRLMVKTKLTGSIADAERKFSAFAKAVPASGRSEIRQKGDLALTIINPEQYRDEIYRRVAAGSKHASSFYGPDYGVEIVGLDREIAWEQVSNTEVFLYIPYSFKVLK